MTLIPGYFRYTRRHWYENLSFKFEVTVLRRAYGGNVGNVNVVWKSDSTNEMHDTNAAKVTLEVTEAMPVFHTRQMKNDFKEKVVSYYT